MAVANDSLLDTLAAELEAAKPPAEHEHEMHHGISILKDDHLAQVTAFAAEGRQEIEEGG